MYNSSVVFSLLLLFICMLFLVEGLQIILNMFYRRLVDIINKNASGSILSLLWMNSE